MTMVDGRGEAEGSKGSKTAGTFKMMHQKSTRVKTFAEHNITQHVSQCFTGPRQQHGITPQTTSAHKEREIPPLWTAGRAKAAVGGEMSSKKVEKM